MRLLLGVIAYNLGNMLRRLVLPVTVQDWSLTSLSAAVVQDRRATDPACPVLHAAARRELLDRAIVSPDPRAHRATGMVSDMIGQTVWQRAESTTWSQECGTGDEAALVRVQGD